MTDPWADLLADPDLARAAVEAAQADKQNRAKQEPRPVVITHNVGSRFD